MGVSPPGKNGRVAGGSSNVRVSESIAAPNSIHVSTYDDLPNIPDRIFRSTTRSDYKIPTTLNPHFGRSGMAQETKRTSSSRVGSGLEDPNEVADIRRRQLHRTAQGVQGRAQRTDNLNGFAGGNIEFA